MVNKTLETGLRSNVGRIGITSISSSLDVTEYTVEFKEAVAPSVTWDDSAGTLIIESASSDNIDNVISMASSGTPWATLTNMSPKGKTQLPVFAETEFDLLPNYIHAETANGRYYPKTGQIWQWYEGYSSDDGDVGDTDYGRWINSKSKYKYMIEVVGNITYLGTDPFTIYLTTGRSYNIDSAITDIPTLVSNIVPGTGTIFTKDVDYTFYNSILEFNNDLFEEGQASIGDYLYGYKAPAIEDNLYNMYGSLVNITDWKDYNYNNWSGKAGINALLKSLQDVSNRNEYERALNVYYGLPVSPDNGQVIGLYESYGYEILVINGNQITLDIPSGDSPYDGELHPFVQPGTWMLCEGKKEVIVSTVDDRASGLITMEDASDLSIGDKIHVKLKNRFQLKRLLKEDQSIDLPGEIDIYSFEDEGGIQHLIDTVQSISDNERYPEIIVYGTDKLERNYDGIYHITNATLLSTSNNVRTIRLTVYYKDDIDDPLYNDYIGYNSGIMEGGYVHIPWPTHKFLYLLLNREKYYKAYLDAPIDTIYDVDDIISKYDTIARNVNISNDIIFPEWTQFDLFKKQNGINTESDVLQLISSMPNAEFGKYFPSDTVSLV